MPPTRPALPPGPERGPLLQAVTFHRDPLGVLRALRARYGDVVTVRFPEARPLVVVADPAEAVALAPTDPARTHAGSARRRILPQASPRSSFGGDGEQHRAARARLRPAFAPAATEGRRAAMAAVAEEHAARWPTGRPFRLLPRLRLLADEITTRLVLGVRDPARARELAPAIRRMLWTPGNPPLSPPGEGHGLMGALGTRFADHRMAPVRRHLLDELAARRRAGDTDGDDLLGCLLRADPPLTDDEAVDEVLPVLMAAQEPMAAALTWVLDRLGRHPDVAARWAAGTEGPAARDAFIREALRLRPPALAMLRRLREPAEVAGHLLPAGIPLVLPIVLLHRDPGAFPEPDAFRPERWRHGQAPPAPYRPYGMGERQCLGQPLAEAQLETVLPAILRRLDVRPLWPQPERMVLRATILVPHRSGLARAVPRA